MQDRCLRARNTLFLQIFYEVFNAYVAVGQAPAPDSPAGFSAALVVKGGP